MKCVETFREDFDIPDASHTMVNSKNQYKMLTGNVCLTDDGQALYNVVGDEFKEYNVDVLDILIGALEHHNCTVYVNNKRVTRMNF